MTKRDFFRIIIKLFGLYSLLIAVFTVLPGQIALIMGPTSILYYVWIFGTIALVAGAYILLILKTDKVIDWLKIDQGFDDDQIILGNFSSSKIVKLGLIIIGGFLIIDYLPGLIRYAYFAFSANVSTDEITHSDSYGIPNFLNTIDILQSLLNVVLGYILITEYKRIGGWIEKNPT